MGKKKLKKLSAASEDAKSSLSAKSIMESASQIWLAGLGAFAKAQEEGEKIFDALVKEGTELESKSRKITTEKVDDVREVLEDTVSKVQSKASQSWDKLEKVFEQRVAKALGALGVPTAKDVQNLAQKVDELHRAVKAYKTDDSPVSTEIKAKKKVIRKKATAKSVVTPVKAVSKTASATRKKLAKKKVTKKTASKVTKKAASKVTKS